MIICRVYQDGCPKRDRCDGVRCVDHRETLPVVRVKAWRRPNEDDPPYSVIEQRERIWWIDPDKARVLRKIAAMSKPMLSRTMYADDGPPIRDWRGYGSSCSGDNET